MSTPLVIATIVSRFAQLKQLTDRANRLHDLNQSLLEHVPPALAAHIRLATLRDGCLVVQAEGSAWAAQLRFKAPEILEKLARHPDFSGIRSIRVRNNIDASAPTVAPPPRAAMSQRAAQALRTQAECTADAALRAALERLARRARD